MPTDLRFDDLDLREEPQMSSGETDAASQGTFNCNHSNCCGSVSCCTKIC